MVRSHCEKYFLLNEQRLQCGKMAIRKEKGKGIGNQGIAGPSKDALSDAAPQYALFEQSLEGSERVAWRESQQGLF